MKSRKIPTVMLVCIMLNLEFSVMKKAIESAHKKQIRVTTVLVHSLAFTDKVRTLLVF